MRISLAVLVAIAVCNRLAQAQSSGETARISGRIALSKAIASRKMRFRLYADLGPGSAPQREAPDSGEMSNVIVYLESTPELAARATAGRPVVVSQVDETFSPHVVAVTRGTSVEFKNDDPFFHNIFSLSKAKTFDLGRYPQSDSRTVRFDRPGVVEVFCHIHADMSAVVMVLDHPFFARPDPDGRYQLDRVPPGTYRLIAWHERAHPVIDTVRIATGESVVRDLSIPIPPDAGRHP
jgi:plastocyanin